jgi:hypothetical protein
MSIPVLPPDELLFDDDSKNIAFGDIDSFITAWSSGQTGFPSADELAFSCNVLMIMGACSDDKQGRNLVMSLMNPKGVSYAMIFPFMVQFKTRMSVAIAQARMFRQNQFLPGTELEEVPF